MLNACGALSRKGSVGDGNTVGDQSRSHGSEGITVGECSAAVLRAVENRDTELVMPFKLQFVPWLNLLWPGFLRRIIWRMVGSQKK